MSEDKLAAYYTAKAARDGAYDNYEVARRVWLKWDEEMERARLAAVLAVPCPARECSADEPDQPCRFADRPPMTTPTYRTHEARQDLAGVNGESKRRWVVEQITHEADGFRRVPV